MRKTRTVHAGNFGRHPSWFRIINYTWQRLLSLGAEIKIEKDALIASAKKATGLNDLGRDFWDEPLDKLIWSVNHEAQLHPIGRFITQQRLVNLLATRLRAEWWFRKRPEILDQELYPVWLITGLQRTGTTKLQRLLSADPDNRPLLSWEALNPVPLDDDAHETKKRIRIARTSEWALKIMAPDFFAIHPVEHLAPEEDILLLDVSFLSTTAEATMNVPSYASWLEKTDQSPAYDYAAKLMKALQWQRPAKRWVLKSPHHLEFFREVAKSFKNVHVFWTHRNIYECIPSFLSMVAYSRALFSENIDEQSIANHWLRKTGYMLDQAVKYRINEPTNIHFTDIDYHHFVADTPAVLHQVYEHMGGVNDELKVTFDKIDQQNNHGKYGNHLYQLEDFNLQESDVLGSTGSYLQFLQDHHINRSRS